MYDLVVDRGDDSDNYKTGDNMGCKELKDRPMDQVQCDNINFGNLIGTKGFMQA